MSAAESLAPPDPSTIDHFVYLRVGWNDLVKLLAMRGERSVPRITYLNGVVELLSGALTFFSLRGGEGNEHYVEIERSALVPLLPVELLLRCMREPNQAAAVKALRAAV